MKKLIVLLVILAVSQLNAATVGVVETFDESVGTNFWWSYSYDDGDLYSPYYWDDDVEQYIYVDCDENGWELCALASASGGIFVGDYTAAGVTGIGFSAYVDDYEAVFFTNLYVVAGGDLFGMELLFSDNDWDYGIIPTDSSNWYNYTDQAQGAPSALEWANVTELGFYAQSWSGESTYLNIDDVQLVPEPATLCLFGLGGLVLRRRRSA
jgi:hypothetical protein